MSEKDSLTDSIKFLENKMNTPFIYGEWKSRIRPQLNELKRKLKERRLKNER